MRRHFNSLAVRTSALLLTATLGCAAFAQSNVAPKASEPASTNALVAAINSFGFDLLGMAGANHAAASPNLIISPLSVHAVTSMAANGASGNTARQMRKVLHISALKPVDANNSWAFLLDGLAHRSNEQTLLIANALWARQDVHFNPDFLAENRDKFHARVDTLDFTHTQAAPIINEWVSKNTNGMIPKIIDKVPDNTLLLLANAVYFKGDWAIPFKHDSTDKMPFTRADGSQIEVAMMHAALSLPFAQNGSLRATRLTYRGGDAAFYIFLPKPGTSLDAARASLAGGGFAELRHSMEDNPVVRVALGLPKLDADYGADLAPMLARLGMPDAFSVRKADFSAMTNTAHPVIGAVLHKTRLKVDEKGSEAAAATVMGMATATAAPRTPPEQMLCDHPYLFAIADEKTGALLLLGTINDPAH
jgi:serine protease inhibitor